MSAVSDQYAIALFELAGEAGDEASVQTAFETFLDALDAAGMTFFMHPKITKTVKKETINSMEHPQIFNDFLCVVIDNNRFADVKAMYQGYKTLLEDRQNIMRIHVYSGKPLTKEKIQQLSDQYKQKYRRQVVIENHHDPTIVAGLRFEYNGLVIEDTVNHILNQIKSHLTK